MAKVLVVEDDEDIRNLVVRRVSAGGHTVMAVGDADDAFALIDRQGRPDVAVLDVGLPGIDGVDLLIALRERLDQPDFPAVFLSARSDQADVERGRALGATYLTKPFVTAALLTAIKTVVPPGLAGW